MYVNAKKIDKKIFNDFINIDQLRFLLIPEHQREKVLQSTDDQLDKIIRLLYLDGRLVQKPKGKKNFQKLSILKNSLRNRNRFMKIRSLLIALK